MTVERSDIGPEQIREKSRVWFRRQLETVAKSHGSRWPEHREWVVGYLREELRGHMIAAGVEPADALLDELTRGPAL